MPGLSAAALTVVHVWGISKTREMHAPHLRGYIRADKGVSEPTPYHSQTLYY